MKNLARKHLHFIAYGLLSAGLLLAVYQIELQQRTICKQGVESRVALRAVIQQAKVISLRLADTPAEVASVLSTYDELLEPIPPLACDGGEIVVVTDP